MSLTIHPDAPPLRIDETGTVRVGKTRVVLEAVVQAFRDGATPEQVVQDYDTLELADVYGVVAYYLRHREEVDAYLADRDREAAELSGWRTPSATCRTSGRACWPRARSAPAREAERATEPDPAGIEAWSAW